jgi:hypothetical protein
MDCVGTTWKDAAMRTWIFLGAVGMAAACGGGQRPTTSGTSGAAGAPTSGTGGSSGLCRQESDCSDLEPGDVCVPPDGPSGFCGGACTEGPVCATDADCADQGPATICGQDPCACATLSGGTCVPGCTTDADCDTGEVCAPSHHCQPKPCTGATDCPAHFDCEAVSAGCQRRACGTDADCTTGFCVQGACYDALGTCEQPPV